MTNSNLFILFLLIQSIVCGAVSSDTITGPYPAHAHNDYLHEHPLTDAMNHGFRSIEADVFSGGDSLYVAHNKKDIRSGRTLRALYMDPLKESFSDGRLTMFDGTCPLILLIDIKDNGLTTYRLLDHILTEYSEMLCQVSQEKYIRGQVMVVVSGNRPIEFMAKQKIRFAFVDGRIEDLTKDYAPLLMPLISDRWPKYFSWRGKDDIPEKEKIQLKAYVQKAHENSQLMRFWATPDKPGKERESVWEELLDAEVDLLNTDDLAGLRSFMLEQGEPSCK